MTYKFLSHLDAIFEKEAEGESNLQRQTVYIQMTLFPRQIV